MAKIQTPAEYTYRGWRMALVLNVVEQEKRIGHNTTARLVNDGGRHLLLGVAIRLHNTDVVTYWENGAIVLNSGGYQTTITKQRMNAVLPQRYRVFARQFTWYVQDGGFENGTRRAYADGMTLWNGFGG